jgi:predicted nucleic acid-binding protein
VPLVLDASITMAWCFEDEASALADAVLESLAHDYAVVPSLWRLEIANVLLSAERRGRLTQAQADRFVSLVGSLAIRFDDAVTMSQCVALGRIHGLSAYDAAYLATASNFGLPLASRDRRMLSAAETAGVVIVGAP